MKLPDNCHRMMPVKQSADIVSVRGIADTLAAGIDMPAVQLERFNLIITELGTNLLRHATNGGTMLIRRLHGGSGLECICYDRGPGIADLGRAMRAGETTGDGLGLGLGAARQLSSAFEIHSEPGVGTAILARVRDGEADPPGRFRAGAVMLPMAGMTYCGDGWLITTAGMVVVIDGLGHGPEASLAARRAEASAMAGNYDPRHVIETMNKELRGTRGAVVMAVLLADHCLRFAGVGNIAGTVIGIDRTTPLHSGWGVVGGNATAPPVHEVAWQPGDVLLLNSDGLAHTVKAFASRHLRYVDPTLAAAIVLRDASAKLDDQTVVVVRHEKRPAAARVLPSG